MRCEFTANPSRIARVVNPLDDSDRYYDIKSYSPYDQVAVHCYPNMLVTASLAESMGELLGAC